jgi:hypothetical protein
MARGIGPTLLDKRITEALNHPVRVQWLVEAGKAPLSPVQFHRLHGKGERSELSKIAYHARVLLKLGFLEIVDTKPRRGGTEHFYGPKRPALFDEDGWSALPTSIRDGFNGAIYSTLCEQIAEAIETGTMEMRPDRHFTWTQIELDDEGWTNMLDRLQVVFDSIQEEQQAARRRLAANGDAPIQMTIALAGFESPPPKR